MPVNLNEDRMLSSMRVLDAADRLNNQAIRGQQMEMQVKEYDLNRRRTEVAEAQQRNVLDSELRKSTAAKALADFSAVFDPTDTDHRSKLDWYTNWAVGEGMSEQEVNQGFTNANDKMRSMENVLSNWRVQSGVDWVKTPGPDGRERIDIGATEAKHNEILTRRKTEENSWSPKDRMIFDRLKGQGMQENESWVYANESATAKRMLDDAQKVAAEKGYPLLIDTDTLNGLRINLRDPKAQNAEGLSKETLQVVGAPSLGTEVPQQGISLPLYYYDLEKVSAYLNKELYGKEGALKELQDSKKEEADIALRKNKADAQIAESRAQLGAAGPAADAISALQQQFYLNGNNPERQAKIQDALGLLVDILPTASPNSSTGQTQSQSQGQPRQAPKPIRGGQPLPPPLPGASPSPTPTTP